MGGTFSGSSIRRARQRHACARSSVWEENFGGAAEAGLWRSPCGDWPAVPLCRDLRLRDWVPRAEPFQSWLVQGERCSRGSCTQTGPGSPVSVVQTDLCWLGGALRGSASGPWFPDCLLSGPQSTPLATSGTAREQPPSLGRERGQTKERSRTLTVVLSLAFRRSPRYVLVTSDREMRASGG